MSDDELRIVRFQCSKTHLDMSGPTAGRLLADRDYHFTRAEEAEEEAAQTLADLAATTTKLKEAQLELAALRGELIR